MTGRGVRAMVVRMPQVHDRTKQGFASYVLDHAREKGSSAHVGEGLNRWPQDLTHAGDLYVDQQPVEQPTASTLSQSRISVRFDN